MPLPDFVSPMLATLVGEPFDSERHLFEVKWDGIRALSFIEGGAYRLLSRNRQDLAPAFPELACLAGFPAGTVLDGELVVLQEGNASFPRAIERMHARNPLKIRALARGIPALYVVFDLLYREARPLLAESLRARRAALCELVAAAKEAHVVASDGVIGPGRAFFEEIRARSIEGLVAKDLDSTYQPGKRTRAWTKVKTTRTMPCVILGFLEDERGDLASLIIGAEENGRIVCVGRVGSGLSNAVRARLSALCRARARSTPIVECAEAGSWVEPGLFCTVSYLERTQRGLRAPVFVELLERG